WRRLRRRRHAGQRAQRPLCHRRDNRLHPDQPRRRRAGGHHHRDAPGGECGLQAHGLHPPGAGHGGPENHEEHPPDHPRPPRPLYRVPGRAGGGGGDRADLTRYDAGGGETMELKDYRDKLDRIDDQMAALFRERMETVREVADYKREHNTPVLASGRERDILYRVTGLCGGELEEYTKILWSTLLELSRDYQQDYLTTGESPLCRQILEAAERTGEFPRRAVVACQGVEGAYSQIACDKLFPLSQILYCNRFDGVFRAVESGMCRYGILPIENSAAGSVTEVYDLMEKYDCKIVRSLKLKVEHCLLAKPGVKLSDVREVVAHEQALDQCSDFLKSSGAKITVFSNNAAAAKYVAESGRADLAAIASANCGGLYGLEAL